MPTTLRKKTEDASRERLLIMKTNKIIKTVLLLLLVVACFVFVARISYKIALKNLDTQFQIASKDTKLTDVKVNLYILKSLRTNDYAKAIEVLERLLDTDLYSLADYELGRNVSDKEIEKTVKSVKSYRDKYKDHKVNPGFEKTINKLLNKYN
jgi:hypothetical protein